LVAELLATEYGYDAQGRLQMESKRDMKARGLASPDHADALVFTFAEPVPVRGFGAFRTAQAIGAGFDPLRR
jgi:hypothetical protein